MNRRHQCGLGISLLLMIGLVPSHGTRDAVCLVLASLCAFGRSGKAPCRCRADACPVIAVRRCLVRRRVCPRPTGGGAAGTEADTLGARTTRGYLAASRFLPLPRSGRAVRPVPVGSGLVLARPSAAQRSSSWGNAAAPRGPRRAASVGRRMGSGASPHSPLRQPRRHGCCPCRAPLLGYPAAAGPSCRGRLPAPRGGVAATSTPSPCPRAGFRMLLPRPRASPGRAPPVLGKWAARLGAFRGPARAPPRVAPVCLRDSAAPHGARTVRESPGTTAGTRYSCAKPKLPRENLNFELVFASWLLC
jgi:hypothetical protein